MKRELAVTGLALIVAILLSSPALAQTSDPTGATPAPAPAAAATEPEPILSLDELVQGDFADEDHARMLMRCIGPRPQPFPAKHAESGPGAAADEPATSPTPLRQ